MNICLRLKDEGQRNRLVALCEAMDWRCATLATLTEIELLHASSVSVDLLICDDFSIPLPSGDYVPVALTTDSDPANRSLEAHWLKLSTTMSDEELAEQLRTAVNVQRLARDLNGADDLEPTTRLPFEEILLERWRRRRLDGGAILAIHVDHGDHLYANLDPIAATEALAGIARRLQSQLPRNAEVGIRDAANFIVIVPKLDRASSHSLSEALLTGFREAFDIAGNNVFLTVSIGCIWQRSIARVREVAEHAWLAQNAASDAGGNRIRRGVQKPEPMQQRIPQAVEADEFSIVLQGQWSIDGRELVGAEALVRWHGMDVGELRPSHFIPAAERTGTINRVGDWVLEQAGKHASTWFEQRLTGFHLGVNVSAQQFFDGSLSRRIRALQEQKWLDPAMLELELSQAALASVLDNARDEVYILKDLGVRLCLDQLGGSLIDTTDLLRMPVDTLKIDRSVVGNVGTSTTANALADQVIQLANRYDLRLIAVGVETEMQRDSLQALGCQIAQGYLYSHPQSPAEFLDAVTRSGNEKLAQR